MRLDGLFLVVILVGCGKQEPRLDGRNWGTFRDSAAAMFTKMTLEEERECRESLKKLVFADGASRNLSEVLHKLDALSASDIRERAALLGPDDEEDLRPGVLVDMLGVAKKEVTIWRIRDLEKKRSSDPAGFEKGDEKRLKELRRKLIQLEIYDLEEKKCSDPTAFTKKDEDKLGALRHDLESVR